MGRSDHWKKDVGQNQKLSRNWVDSGITIWEEQNYGQNRGRLDSDIIYFRRCYRRCGGTSSFHLEGESRSFLRNIGKKLPNHCAITQKTTFWPFIAIKTWRLFSELWDEFHTGIFKFHWRSLIVGFSGNFYELQMSDTVQYYWMMKLPSMGTRGVYAGVACFAELAQNSREGSQTHPKLHYIWYSNRIALNTEV